jgi:SAM-dependent methyltransferase
MAKVTRIPRCRLCDSDHLENVLPLRPTPVGDWYLPAGQNPGALETYPLDLNLCLSCGHAQLSALVDPGEIYSNYLYTTSISLGLADHFREYANTVCRKLDLSANSLVVDIGSNDGTLLRVFQQKGMRVVGVDPAREIARRATESGIPTINAFFTPALAAQIVQTHGRAALVIANNVVANVPDPVGFFTGVEALLADNGRFVWETGYVRYLTEDCVFDNVHHEHIDYYAVRPLTRFYQRFGFVLQDVEVSTSKGSSIRSYVARTSSKPVISPSVAEVVAHEEAADYFSPAPFARLALKLDATREKLHTLLRDWHTAGKSVAGYGAAIGTTTVLYHFELGAHLRCLIDDNPVRHGLVSPGYALQVEPASLLAGPSRPDYVLILAWRYADPIIQRNQTFLQNGGAFVKILPEVTVVTRDATVPNTTTNP